MAYKPPQKFKGEERACKHAYSQRVGRNSSVLNLETPFEAMNIIVGRKRYVNLTASYALIIATWHAQLVYIYASTKFRLALHTAYMPALSSPFWGALDMTHLEILLS